MRKGGERRGRGEEGKSEYGAFVNVHFPALQRTEPTFLCFRGPTVNPVGSPLLDQLTCLWADAVAVGLWSCTLLSWLYMGHWLQVDLGGIWGTTIHSCGPSVTRPEACKVAVPRTACWVCCGASWPEAGWVADGRGPGFWVRLPGFLQPSPPSHRKKCQLLAKPRSSVT